MKLKLVITADGSHTVYVPVMNEHFHSVHGAILESQHVFIEAGFNQFCGNKISLLEIGFGTGLNTLLTLLEAKKSKMDVIYHSVEKYPLEKNILNGLNYVSILGSGSEKKFKKIHDTSWNEEASVSDSFKLKKIQGDLITVELTKKYDLIYFDAFSPEVQPEMWDKVNFQKIFNAMNPGGILTTYSSKGSVRRTLAAIGFKVERIPGPPGKREMLRAWLPAN